MQDRQLYAQILGIEEPWHVDRVDLQLDAGEVHVYLTHSPTAQWQCAECAAAVPLYDHQPERVLAASGHLSIPDVAARGAAADHVCDAWRAGGEAALGRAIQPASRCGSNASPSSG